MSTQTISDVVRDYEIEGVPASGAHQVNKRELREWGESIETLLTGSGATVAFPNLAAIDANLNFAANTYAFVYADTTAANNGAYLKSGGIGAGSWARVGDLPGAIVPLTVTGGTGNAIVASASETPQAPNRKLYLLTPTSNNTGATTIAVDGASAVAIKNALGSALASGSLIIGNPALMVWQTDHYQLLVAAAIDGNPILADAVAARDAAIAAAAAVTATSAADRTALKGIDTTTFKACLLREAGREGAFVFRSGDFSSLVALDTQEGIYVKATAVAASSGAWVRSSNGNVNVLNFGVDNTGAGNALSALQVAVDVITISGLTICVPAGTYDLGSGTLLLPENAYVLAHPNAVIQRSADPTFTTANLAMIMAGNYSTWSGGQFSNTVASAAVQTLNSPYVMFNTDGARLYNVRTIGKWYVGPYFYAVNPPSTTVTMTIASPGVVTFTSHNLSPNHPVKFTTSGALPTGITASTTYYVVGASITTNTFRVSISPGGAAINTTGSQSGTHTCQAVAITKDCIIADCVSVTAANRGFYVYGNNSNCKISKCVIEGGGTTTYGVNCNAANASGSNNSISHLLVEGCTAVSCTTNSFVFGDFCFYCTFNACTVFTSGNTGFTIEVANAGVPQFCSIVGCIVNGATTNGFLLNGCLYSTISSGLAIACGVGVNISSANAVQYCSVTSTKVVSATGNGIDVAGNSVRCDLEGVQAINCVGTGILVRAGASVTRVNGRAFGNGTNYTDSGTSTVSVVTVA